MKTEKFLKDNIKRLDYYANHKPKGSPGPGDNEGLQELRRQHARKILAQLVAMQRCVERIRNPDESARKFQEMVTLLPILEQRDGFIAGAEALKLRPLKGLRSVLRQLERDSSAFYKKINPKHRSAYQRSLQKAAAAAYITTDVARSPTEQTQDQIDEVADLTDAAEL
ncbi:hypothetical protein [Piscirickettsia salmonis]|uniref:hypothetical protein n=1 Tax=Piscirickettsia salmonis TaxID=1238 RepID=UPI0007C8C575|nr:hypothetical protein A0O36_02370 [Piscirickettsiaceae bacterium NZ-RLO1]